MGKNNDTTSKAAPAKRAAEPSSKTMRAAEPAIVTPPAKTAARKNGARAAAKPQPAKRASKPASAPGYTQTDISLRAYFIAEKRVAAGLPGDSHQDWLEAERQIMAEAAAAKKPKAKAKKA